MLLPLDNRVKKSLPEKYQQKTQSSLLIAVVSAAVATLTCYPLDTVRRQMQMKGTPYKSVLDAFPGKVHKNVENRHAWRCLLSLTLP